MVHRRQLGQSVKDKDGNNNNGRKILQIIALLRMANNCRLKKGHLCRSANSKIVQKCQNIATGIISKILWPNFFASKISIEVEIRERRSEKSFVFLLHNSFSILHSSKRGQN